MGKFKFIKNISLALLSGVFVLSCSDDDDSSTKNPDVVKQKISYVITSGNAKTDLKGGNSLLVLNDLSKSKDTTVLNNPNALFVKDAFTQVSYNQQSKVFTGYIYGRGANELGSAGLRSYVVANGKLKVLGDPVKLSNFGNTGTFGKVSYAAAISASSVMVVSRNGETVTGQEKLVDLKSFAIDGTTPSITGIVDRGDNQLAIALNYANHDTAAVAFTNYNLEISSVQYDNRIGSSYGAWRSVRYAQIGKDANDNLYVFSGTGKNGVGALKIKKGESLFDKNYFFDILKASDGYRFRKVFPISDDYFLLEFYYEKDKYGNMDNSGRFAVVKMSDKSFKWVTGLPVSSEIKSIAWPDGNDGTIYLPINLVKGKPTIYAINAKTAEAKVTLRVGESELLKAITIIKE